MVQGKKAAAVESDRRSAVFDRKVSYGSGYRRRKEADF